MAIPCGPKSLLRKLCEKVQVPSGLHATTNWPERLLMVGDKSNDPEQNVALEMQVHAMASQVNVEALAELVVEVAIVWLQEVALQ